MRDGVGLHPKPCFTTPGGGCLDGLPRKGTSSADGKTLGEAQVFLGSQVPADFFYPFSNDPPPGPSTEVSGRWA